MSAKQRARGMAWIICGASLTLLAQTVAAQGADAPQPPKMGEMFVQTVPAQRYVYGGLDTDFLKMGEPLVKVLMALGATALEQKVGLHGPVVDVYYAAPHRSPEKAFKMEVGYFLRDEATAVGEFKVRELPKFKCASLLFVGPATNIGSAWQALYGAVGKAGLKATDEERELYLYFEGVDSPNNVVQVQVGVE